MSRGRHLRSLLTDTPGPPYTNPRQCDMLAADYKSLHLLPALMWCRAGVEHTPDVISLSRACMSHSARASSGRDTAPHRGWCLRGSRRDKSVAATPYMHCDCTGRGRNAWSPSGVNLSMTTHRDMSREQCDRYFGNGWGSAQSQCRRNLNNSNDKRRMV